MTKLRSLKTKVSATDSRSGQPIAGLFLTAKLSSGKKIEICLSSSVRLTALLAHTCDVRLLQ